MLVEVRATWDPGLILHCLKLAHKPQASGAPVCASHLAVRAQGFQTCAAMPVFPVALGISQVFILTHSAQPAPCSLTYSGFVRVVGMNMV